MYGPAHGWISLPLWPGSFAAELPAAGGTPAARAGSQRPPGPRADRAPRPAPEPRLLPPRPAPSGRAGADAPQRGRPARRLLQPRPGPLWRAADRDRRGAPPGPATRPTGARRGRSRAALPARPGAVPVHREQRPLADGRSADQAPGPGHRGGL